MRRLSVLNVTVWASVCCLLGFLTVSPARADNLYGTIRGTATDQTGAVIPGVTVTVTNQDTGISKTAVSQSDGSFEFVNLLAPATYRVVVEKQGFRKSVSENIHLEVNQVFVANATLEVGATTQEVTVQAQTAQINTTSMQLGTTITGNTIEDLPLNGRNWIQLQQLQPGVVGASDRFGTGTMGTNFSTNGNQTQQNSFYVNGVDTADISLNMAGVIPSPDAIGEFHMVTSTINPEYGRNSGAIMNAVIKNGTNSLHGDGFEFYRDTSLDARNFFQATVAPFHQNQFGGVVGGPVVLPHIYNGRNKTFFFFSYQGTRNVEPETYGVPTVFTQDQRNGAFAGLATSTGSSAFPLVGDNGTTYPAGTSYSTLFSGGTIPQADLNPLAVKLMNQYVPLPNAPGNGYQFNPTTTTVDDQYITRIDETFRPQDSIWGYFLWERTPTTNTLPFAGANLPGFAAVNQFHAQQLGLSWNHTFSPTTLNEARFGYFRFNFAATFPENPITPASYGFTGINPQVTSYASLPYMAVTGLFNLGFSEFGPQPRLENTYEFIDNFSKVAGKHTVKAGFLMNRYQIYNPFSAYLNGAFTFAGTGTFSTGVPGADFLLGLPDSYVQTNGSVIDSRAQEYYSYVQDEFKVRPNLTLTFGVGWDIETPYTNLYYNGRNVNAWRPGQQSTVFPTAPVGILWPGDTGITSTGGVSTKYGNFGPRFGFAWSPGKSSKWSVHGGYGIYYNRTEEELALQNLTAPPFSLTSFGVGGIGGSPSLAGPFSGWCGQTSGPPIACSTANQFPYVAPAAGTAVNFAPLEPLTINSLSKNFGVPNSQNWNIMLERQMTNSMTLTAAYVGNVARHLEGDYELNPAGQVPGMNPVAAAIPPSLAFPNGCTAANLGHCAPATFPYNTAIYGGINQQATAFNSNYNSFQISVNQHLSHGLTFLAAYTWSRYFDQNSTADNQDGFQQPGINPFSFASMYAPSDNDAPQRFVFSGDYALPFYHYVPHARALVDGWKLVGIVTFQHGFPILVANTADPSLTCWSTVEVIDVPCWDRPNTTGAPFAIGNPRNYTINGNPNYWFNPSAFSMAAAGTGIGSSSRNPLYGAGINNFDIALLKDIHLTESKYIQLRVEAFNAWNHTQFATGSYQPGNNIGGVVSDINDSRFGRMISANAARIFQLSGKFYF